MKAARIHQFGPPSVIVVEDVGIPTPGQNQVLVRVLASGVGPWDSRVRSGRAAECRRLPLTLGSDMAGIVESVGSEVSIVSAGDVVYGVTDRSFTGANAEYAISSDGMIARKPRQLNFIRAASVPVVAVAAWQMLFDHARASPGQNVLVHGARGNVGGFAVQLARHLGAHVFATGEVGDARELAELGVGHVIDMERAPLDRYEGVMDVTIDTVGGVSQSALVPLLKRGGILVSAVSTPDEKLAAAHGIRTKFFTVNVTTAYLDTLSALLDSQQIVTRVGVVLPLSEIPLAHEMLDGQRHKPRGKIVLAMDEAGALKTY